MILSEVLVLLRWRRGDVLIQNGCCLLTYVLHVRCLPGQIKLFRTAASDIPGTVRVAWSFVVGMATKIGLGVLQ